MVYKLVSQKKKKCALDITSNFVEHSSLTLSALSGEPYGAWHIHFPRRSKKSPRCWCLHTHIVILGFGPGPSMFTQTLSPQQSNRSERNGRFHPLQRLRFLLWLLLELRCLSNLQVDEGKKTYLMRSTTIHSLKDIWVIKQLGKIESFLGNLGLVEVPT